MLNYPGPTFSAAPAHPSPLYHPTAKKKNPAGAIEEENHASATNEGTSNGMRQETEWTIEEFSRVLSHIQKCRKREVPNCKTCRRQTYARLKAIVEHSEYYLQSGFSCDCPDCKMLEAVICFHASGCKEASCLVPRCCDQKYVMQIRDMLQKNEAQYLQQDIMQDAHMSFNSQFDF